MGEPLDLDALRALAEAVFARWRVTLLPLPSPRAERESIDLATAVRTLCDALTERDATIARLTAALSSAERVAGEQQARAVAAEGERDVARWAT